MSKSKTEAPYGSWESPITSNLLVSRSDHLGDIRVSAEGIFWTEGRPLEKGRSVLVQMDSKGKINDCVPSTINVRTQAHEYGGICFVPFEDRVYYVNYADQRIYCKSATGNANPLTPVNKMRYADLIVDAPRQRLIAVCEDHSAESQEARNYLVAIDMQGEHAIETLTSGADFYSNPRISPDGTQLAWLSWNHPNMPWDGTDLMLADLDEAGTLKNAKQVAGGLDISVFQPEWSPGGALYFVADPEGWWNLHRYQKGQVECVLKKEAEFGLALWVFGMSTYAIHSDSILYCTYCVNGIWSLGRLNIDAQTLTEIPTEFTDIHSLSCYGDTLVFLGCAPSEPNGFYAFDSESERIRLLKRAGKMDLDTADLSTPKAVEYPTGNGSTAHAFYYPPQNKNYTGLPGELPPLRVIIHGGPTGLATSSFSLSIQYWTSRGFAVMDVNHRGSTGYGRAYRTQLNGNWGVMDREDCLNGAQYLVSEKLADPKRLTIRGGSAGGYSVLSALTFGDVFSAGASYYGICDLEALVSDTHKFEARYMDSLVGPHPEKKEVYQARSPIHHTDQLSCPVIILQGLEDKIVPPNQSEMMVNALKAKGIPVAYLTFEGEQHGFRNAKNIKRSLEGELSFYAQLFGFDPAETIDPTVIMRG